MGTIIIIIILLIVVAFSLRGSVKHLRGQGGCCGGGSTPRTKKKKLTGELAGKKVITIDGMHCQNCKNSVEREINRIEGAAAKVHLEQNLAVVSMTREISDDELTSAVEQAGFLVTGIRREEKK